MAVLLVVVTAVTVVAFVGAAAMAARRLLGVHFGLLRLVLAGGVALAVSRPLSRAMQSGVPRSGAGLTSLWFAILAAAVSVLIAMAVLVIAEALVPTGSIPTPAALLRGLRTRVARSRRYAQILRVAARHGFGRYLLGRRVAGLRTPGGRARLARSLRLALADAGVTFVKLGQVLSTRNDLLPAEFVAELSRLQDRVAPAPWEQVEALLEMELGRPVESCFADFVPEPIAAASVAQVHRARLSDGTEVVVKVQRPGIRPIVERDLDVVATFARRLEKNAGWARSMGVVDLAAGLSEAVREELDFRVEEANLSAMARSSGPSRDGVRFPVSYPQLCTARVLVMDDLRGMALSQLRGEADARGARGAELARTLLHSVLRQILVDGVFHADPHPGNVVLLEGGGVGMLDLGSVGRLDKTVRGALGRMLWSLDRGDPIAGTAALLDVVGEPPVLDEQRLERAVGRFIARHLGSYASGGAELFGDLFRLTSANGLTIPREVAAVFRALATLEGSLQRLCPEFDLITEARALVGSLAASQVGYTSAGQSLEQELAALLPTLRRLPRRLDRLAAAAETGRLTVGLRLPTDDPDHAPIAAIVNPALLTVLSATAGIMGVLLLATPGGPRVTDQVSLYAFLSYILLIVSAVLGMRVLALIFRRNT